MSTQAPSPSPLPPPPPRPDSPSIVAPTPTSSGPSSPADDAASNNHAEQVEYREAVEFWGYLFQPDKTGTVQLKSLLRGLKDVVNAEYFPSDNPDLTPPQLAHFYRDLHGNYDQLFLGTPHESIAFIYKSLGCLHSLQPPAFTQSTAFTDPTVPALKTEGWIMWQTIQLLLGPDEHASFLSEAVQRWDVKDPNTGKLFPKILPRACFPSAPDKHMVAWYEGVSERLRREAEEEDRSHESEAAQAETRRIHAKREDTDDEGSVGSKGPALAYFRNPLYRHVDGRPSIVRRNSKRPSSSPRPTSMMGKGKGAVGTFGHIVRNVASPNLWSGKGGGSGSDTRERDKDRDRRRRSLPDHGRHHYPEGLPVPENELMAPQPTRSRRHLSNLSSERPPTTGSADDEWDANEGSPVYSPRPGSRPTSHQHSSRGSRESRDPPLGHSKSHDPTPSQKEAGDYFEDYEKQQQRPSQPEQDKRRNSAVENVSPTSSGGAASGNGNLGPGAFGPGGFGPSASPLFATHIARQPQPRHSSDDPGGNPSLRRAQGPRRDGPLPHPSYNPSSDLSSRMDRADRQFGSPRRARFEQNPADDDDEGYDDDRGPPRSSGRSTGSHSRTHDHSMGPPPPPSAHPSRRSGRKSGSEADYNGPPQSSERNSSRRRDQSERRDGGRRRGESERRNDGRRQGESERRNDGRRRGESEHRDDHRRRSGDSGRRDRNERRDDGRRDQSERRDDGKRPDRSKQTRFAGDAPESPPGPPSPPPPATKGVHGRRYVDESPWR